MGVTSSTAQKSANQEAHARRDKRRLDRFFANLLFNITDVLLDFILDVAEPLLSDRTVFFGQLLDLAAKLVDFDLPLSAA